MRNRLAMFINRLLYKNFDVKNSVHSQNIIMKHGFFQKILGINGHVPWPVHRSSTILAVHNIIPGTRTPGLGKYCYLDGRNGIHIGANVWIGPYVKIISMNHSTENYNKYIDSEPIHIADDCWIGANAIILPGVTLGEHTVVAAGAVVTKSFPEKNQLIGGNPAKFIKDISNYEK